MPLSDLWSTTPEQLRDKQVQQVIAFAGSGKLRDGGEASLEFREFLALVPSSMLSRYVDECLTAKFEDSGLALQDTINEIGRRLGFEITHGYYRGSAGRAGFDGLWKAEDGKSIVVEVKTTDAYRIDLDTVAGYRSSLIKDGTLHPSDSSILIVVGRQDTGDLEAQIRGSKHAWVARLISTDALVRLMHLKENLEGPLVVRKIRDILTPQEFTKVDTIIDIVFATAEDVLDVDAADEQDESPDDDQRKPKFVPSSFHEACIKRIASHLGQSLVKQSRAMYTSTDGSLAVLCTVSRVHGTDAVPAYWYAFHPHQKDTLLRFQTAYVAFGCGSEAAILFISMSDFEPWLEGMNITEKPERFYWHVSIFQEDGNFVLRRKRGYERVDLTRFLLPSGQSTRRPVP